MLPSLLARLRTHRRGLRIAGLVLVVVYALYLAGANVFLNSAWGGRVINRKLVMAQSDARMYVDDREIYSARDLRVGLFTETGSF